MRVSVDGLDLTKLTDAELNALESEMFEVWVKTERIHSLGDYGRIIKEQSYRNLVALLREIDPPDYVKVDLKDLK